MTIRIYNCFVLCVCCMAIYCLFFIKNNVRILNEQINQFNQQISLEKDRLHVLKAELAYLTSPERLSILSAQYLELAAIQPSQMIKDPLTENFLKLKKLDENLALVSNNSSVRWRYKKTSKYIHVSGERIKNYTSSHINNRR